MALMKCRECGNEVSTTAKACPKCGASVQVKETGFGALVLTLLFIAVAGLVLRGLFATSGSNVPERTLSASVRSLGTHFLIQNKDSFPWGDCDLDLNSEYKIEGINIPASEELSLPAVAFATKDGNRFQPITMKPQTFFIYCRQTPYGRLSTAVGWK
jgi:hypothetical protein